MTYYKTNKASNFVSLNFFFILLLINSQTKHKTPTVPLNKGDLDIKKEGLLG